MGFGVICEAWNEKNLMLFSAFKNANYLFTCGGELGFFSADVEASRIGLIRESMNDEGFGVGKLVRKKE